VRLTATFLEISGAWVTASADTTYAFIAGLHQSKNFDFAHLNAWLRENVALNKVGQASTASVFKG
jgi:prophage maintenance system killer protein